MTLIARHIVVLVSACVACLTAPANAQQFVMVFNVTDGMTFIETLRFEKSVVEGKFKPRTTLIVVKSHYTVRKTPNGYSVFLKPVRPVDLAVSEETAALAAGLITNVRVRFDINAAGKLTEIVGAEQAYVEMENALPAEAKPFLRGIGITPVTMKQMLAMDWQLRDLFAVAGRAGRPMTMGARIENPDAVFPSALAGAFRAIGTLRSKGPLPCGNRQCVVFEAFGASQDPALGTVLTKTMSNMLEGTFRQLAPKDTPLPKIPKFLVSEPYEKVRLERSIDTATGLLRSYVQDHDVTAKFSMPEINSPTTPVRITVKRQYTYTY